MRNFLWHVFKVGLDPMIVAQVNAHINGIIKAVEKAEGYGITQRSLDNLYFKSSLQATLKERAQVGLRIEGNLAASYAPVLASLKISHSGVRLYGVDHDRKRKVLTATLSLRGLMQGFQQKASD